MKTIDSAFGRIIVREDVPSGTIFLIPPMKWVRLKWRRYKNEATEEVEERLEFNPKAAGIITNIKP